MGRMCIRSSSMTIPQEVSIVSIRIHEHRQVLNWDQDHWARVWGCCWAGVLHGGGAIRHGGWGAEQPLGLQKYAECTWADRGDGVQDLRRSSWLRLLDVVQLQKQDGLQQWQGWPTQHSGILSLSYGQVGLHRLWGLFLRGRTANLHRHFRRLPAESSRTGGYNQEHGIRKEVGQSQHGKHREEGCWDNQRKVKLLAGEEGWARRKAVYCAHPWEGSMLSNLLLMIDLSIKETQDTLEESLFRSFFSTTPEAARSPCHVLARCCASWRKELGRSYRLRSLASLKPCKLIR